MSEQSKAIVRRLFEELWNKGNLSVADQLFSPNYAHHDPSTPDFGRGPESERKRATPLPHCLPGPSIDDRGRHLPRAKP